MKGLVHLGLRASRGVGTAGDGPAMPWVVLVDRLLAALVAHAPEAHPDQHAAFQAAVAQHRAALQAGHDLATTATACATLCEQFLAGSAQYVADRESALHGMIRMLREAAASVAGDTAKLDAQVLSSADRFAAVSRMPDIGELRQQLTAEVSVLKTAVEARRRREQEASSRLARRLAALQTRLSRAEEDAALDGLTRVANRATFDRRIGRLASASRATAGGLVLAMIDVDDFKQVNDQHGHQLGDHVLISTAMWLTKARRQTDLVARYGGDEFAVVLQGASLDQAARRFEAIVREIASKPVTHRVGRDVHSVHFSISCGVTALGSRDTVDQLIRRADLALYDAKSAGRSRVVVVAPPAEVPADDDPEPGV